MRLNNYIKTFINRMARATGTTLTRRHEEILEYVYYYYQKNNVGPLLYNLKKNVNTSNEEIEKLFPHGLNSVYTWVGIPIQTVDNPCKPPASIKADDWRFVYLDHNATTYIRLEVAKTISNYINEKIGFANPSSSTMQGKEAFEHVSTSRETIAKYLEVSSDEIIFTGCGSESNNHAIKGIALQYMYKSGLEKPWHIITSKIEHPSVLATMQYLETLGFQVTYIKPEKNGIITFESVKKAIHENTILVSIMAVNNEIGTIQPISEIGRYCQGLGIPFMVDAVQAVGKIPLKPKEMGISLMSFSGHKLYAPKGIGGLFIDSGLSLVPLIHGGGQEMGLRSGTENVAYIAAFGLAIELAYKEMDLELKRIIVLRDFFLEELKKIEPDLIVNGDLMKRIPHNLSIGFPAIDTASMLLSLNSIGVCVSSGSACSSGKFETSHVLKAIKADDVNYGTIRFSFGLRTTKEDLRYVLKYIPEIIRQIKAK